MNKFTKGLAVAALVAGAVFAVPVAANAAYAPGTPTTETASATPGGPFSLVFPSGEFIPNHSLTVTFSSTGPVPSTATITGDFLAATSTVSAGAANASGGATLAGTVPAAATGDITATVTDGTNTAVGTIDVAAVAAAGGSTTGLATTGTYISLATVWGAVGLVALGFGFILVRQLGRKRRDTAAHAEV